MFPTAAMVVADLAGWYENELTPHIIEIRDPEHTVLWRDEDARPPHRASGQPDSRWRDRRQAIEEHLSVVLEFATPSLAGWECDDSDDTVHRVITLPDSATPVPGGQPGQAVEVWVLRHIDKHSDDVSLYASRTAGLSALATAVTARWDDIIDNADVPASPDQLSDQHAVDLYFQHRGELESYAPLRRHPGRRLTIGPWIEQEPGGPPIDLATPDGARIYQLFYRLKAEGATETGCWPGGDVVDMLTDWFTAEAACADAVQVSSPDFPACELCSANGSGPITTTRHCPYQTRTTRVRYADSGGRS